MYFSIQTPTTRHLKHTGVQDLQVFHRSKHFFFPVGEGKQRKISLLKIIMLLNLKRLLNFTC